MQWHWTLERIRWIRWETYFQEIYLFYTTTELVRIILFASDKQFFFLKLTELWKFIIWKPTKTTNRMLPELPPGFSSQPLSVRQLSSLSLLWVAGNMTVSSTQAHVTHFCHQTWPMKTIPGKGFDWLSLGQVPIPRKTSYGDGMGSIVGSTRIRCPSLANKQRDKRTETYKNTADLI